MRAGSARGRDGRPARSPRSLRDRAAVWPVRGPSVSTVNSSLDGLTEVNADSPGSGAVKSSLGGGDPPSEDLAAFPGVRACLLLGMRRGSTNGSSSAGWPPSITRARSSSALDLRVPVRRSGRCGGLVLATVNSALDGLTEVNADSPGSGAVKSSLGGGDPPSEDLAVFPGVRAACSWACGAARRTAPRRRHGRPRSPGRARARR